MSSQKINNNPNKKIVNATSIKDYGIKFKSKLEASLFKCLVENGFSPKYEVRKFIIIKGIKPTIPYFLDGVENSTKIRDSTYTPDFYFNYNGTDIYIEAKGYDNDVYPVKKKLFRLLLENNKNKCAFFEVHSKKALLKCIDIIKKRL